MKKLLLSVAVLGTVFLSACEKDQLLVPAEQSSVKTDKGVLCRGCGDWDIADPVSSTDASRQGVTSSADTDSSVSKP